MAANCRQLTEWGKPWCVAALQHLEVEFDPASQAPILKALLEELQGRVQLPKCSFEGQVEVHCLSLV